MHQLLSYSLHHKPMSPSTYHLLLFLGCNGILEFLIKMGKTGKWIKNFLTGKKDEDKGKCDSNQPTGIITENLTTPITIPPTTPKEKRRWSFRRSSATAAGPKDPNSVDVVATMPPITSAPAAMQAMLDAENEQRKHALAVAAATAAAADAAVAAAQAAAAVIRLTVAANDRASAVEEAAAVKIQSVFRSYLARKALSALKGLVKLQALVRGHLVRKQATATLRCMQALVTVQERALAQRINMSEEVKSSNHRQSTHRKSTTQDNKLWNSHHDYDRGSEDNIKIVEMDLGVSMGGAKSRKSYSNNPQSEEAEHRFYAHYAAQHAYSRQDDQQISPAPSALTDMSPRVGSGHFEEYSFTTAQSSPQYYSARSKPDPSRVPFAFHRPEYAESLSYEYPFFPSYMANTESSRAKVRSQSAPKQRSDSCERQPSRRRPSMEGRNIPRAVRMQRSSSQVGSAVQGYQYPWSIKLDKSSVSLKDSECGSTSTVLTNINYCKSLVSYDPQGRRY